MRHAMERWKGDLCRQQAQLSPSSSLGCSIVSRNPMPYCACKAEWNLRAGLQGIATGAARLPLDEWLQEACLLLVKPQCLLLAAHSCPSEVQLHADLAKDIEEKFGSVPQQERGVSNVSCVPFRLIRFNHPHPTASNVEAIRSFSGM